METNDAATWPEQNIIADWILKYKLENVISQQMWYELAVAVTNIRIEQVEAERNKHAT